MSSVNRLELKFTDRDAVRRAVVRCNGEIVWDALTAAKKLTSEYEISRHVSVPAADVNLVFRLRDRAHPFVVTPKGEVITETDNGLHAESADWLDLSHAYTYDLAARHAEENGWSCEETVSETGERLIVIETAA